MFCLRGRTRFSTASPAQPQAFADGLVRLLKDPVLRSRLASAKMLAQTCHSYNVFEDTLNGLYAALEHSRAGTQTVSQQ